MVYIFILSFTIVRCMGLLVNEINKFPILTKILISCSIVEGNDFTEGGVTYCVNVCVLA